MLGTPLADGPRPPQPPSALEMTRVIATARILMPRAMVRLLRPYTVPSLTPLQVRLSAGRMSFTPAEQALMFLAGANSIFYGDQLLTTPNPEVCLCISLSRLTADPDRPRQAALR